MDNSDTESMHTTVKKIIIKKKSTIVTPSITTSEYKKYEHDDHVLNVPDTYVGSVENQDEEVYLCITGDELVDGQKQIKIRKKKISYNPGLYKLYDEILVNAIDHITRLKMQNESKSQRNPLHLVTQIKVEIDQSTGEISVWNDGDGIDIVMLDEYKMYPPELIFGNLLSGTNYNKDDDDTIGGKNGYGAKVVNIFSLEFIVETVDPHRKLKFIQTFTNNMKNKTNPKITSYKSKPFTKITFTPDYKRFGITTLSDDMINLFKKRVYDISSWTDKKISIFYNKEKIPIKTFSKYVDLYIPPEQKRVQLPVNDRWDIIVTHNNEDTFEDISFVNGIHTIRGGKHVDYIVDQIKDGIVEYFKKKHKMNIKHNIVKTQMKIFMKSVISKPSFDSQTKETLTTQRKNFGSTYSVDSKMIDKLMKTDLHEKIMHQAEYKQSKDLQKTDGKKKDNIKGIPKLSDANKAGTVHSKKCTLILTEGDSANTMAIAGLSEVGRDLYGVFPLRGKLLNVKDVDFEKILRNEEINNIKKILGLRNNQEYTDSFKWDLRYGRVMIMTDQDLDGSHIKGLIINLFHSHWPSLLKMNFICSMVTPIIKVTHKKTVLSFYSLVDYDKWKQTVDIQKYKIKYYKGLGTSTTKEAKEYFKNLKDTKYSWINETSDNVIDLVFNKKRADDRKEWLSVYDKEDSVDFTQKEISLDTFFHKDFKHFSVYDNERSIPSICDGLKPSQRKILFSCEKRNLTNEIKVAQLAGYVSEHSGYHHGETSLMSTIIGLAQDYVGSNNINLLMPNGQFGSRIMGGKDSASARYIYTYLNPITSKIFNSSDNSTYKYINDDGDQIEPEYYVPIIPMVLINGIRGIGTGYSSLVPAHNPTDILECIQCCLDDKPMPEIKPYYNNFKGTIEKIEGSDNYMSIGIYDIPKTHGNKLIITELPIGTWTHNYKLYLDSRMIDKSAKGPKAKQQFIKYYVDHSTESTVHFEIVCTPEFYNIHINNNYTVVNEEKLLHELKLTSNSETNYNNMHLFNANHIIQKYKNVHEIIREYFTIRMGRYATRKEHMLNKLSVDANMLQNKVRFIRAIIDNSLDIKNKPINDIRNKLEEFKYDKKKNAKQEDTYDYLTHMPIYSLTKEKVDELEETLSKKEKDKSELESKTVTDLWKTDLATIKL